MATILLADDNHSLLEVLGQHLKSCGHFVISTNNGADVMTLLKKEPHPDLIVMDLLMPGLEGSEVIRSLGPMAPPVIIITGEPNVPPDLTKHPKVQRVLSKVFELDDFMAAVNGVLGDKALVCPPCKLRIPVVIDDDEDETKGGG